MKWLELTVILNDYNRFNEMLGILVKPYIKIMYDYKVIDSWHYFREPSLCWRILANEEVIGGIKLELDDRLNWLEKENQQLFKEHYFGAFLEKGKEYIGEEELYGKDAWELCYKRWEAGSNLALQLCTTEPIKSLPFHYTRDIHLFENQLGFEYTDAITIYLKWLKRLMECDPDNDYKEILPQIQDLINKTKHESKVKGI